MRYTQSGEINFENNDKLGALAQLKSTFPHAKTYELDGLSIDAGEWEGNRGQGKRGHAHFDQRPMGSQVRDSGSLVTRNGPVHDRGQVR